MILTIVKQILTMALYMGVGFLLFKAGKITKHGSKSIAGLLAWAVMPSTILRSFLVDYSDEKLTALGRSAGLGMIALIVAIFLATVLIRPSEVSGVERFAASFSNAGFIGIPLVEAAIGTEGIFYLVGIIILLNILQWTYGVWLLTRSGTQKGEKITLRKIFCNQIVLASLLGFILFVTNLSRRIPSPITAGIEGMAQLNAPVAMIILGVYLAQTDLKSLFLKGRLYYVSALRLFVIPLVTIAVIAILPFDYKIKMTIAIAVAAPVGANVAVYSQLYDADYTYACETVTQSTLFSMISLPLMVAFAEQIIR